MLVSLPHFQWQILRAVLRAEAAGEAPLGRDLRITPTRRTRDGSFLDDLVEDGLLTTVGKPQPDEAQPEPFRKRYELTDLGRHAAEFGEYDRPYTPKESPLTGPAAEIHEALQARRAAEAAGGKSGGKRGKKG